MERDNRPKRGIFGEMHCHFPDALRVTVALILFWAGANWYAASVDAAPPTQGGGPPPISVTSTGRNVEALDATSPETMDAIIARVRAARAQLIAEGKLPDIPSPTVTLLDWPLKPVKTLTDFGYHAVSGFVDHIDAPGMLQDYECGERTYDIGDYDHTGTDYVPSPFPWNKMDKKQVRVIAAAEGWISEREDGNADRSCSLDAPDTPNYVVISHLDGSDTYYLHLKNGSVTEKGRFDPVDAGELIGMVGGSGKSTQPHLHFEVRVGDEVLDPYDGLCNNVGSRWNAQRPYFDSAVNKLTTSYAPPEVDGCTNEKT